MTKKYLLVVAIVFVVAGGVFFVWHSYDAQAKTAKVESEILKELGSDDLRTILVSQPDTAPLVDDVEGRKLFLKGLREYLALAAEARREGLAEDKLFRINYEYKRMLLFADSYERKEARKSTEPFIVPNEELEGVWKDSLNETKFTETMDTLAAIQRDAEKQRGGDAPVSKLSGESLEKARRKWARTTVLYNRALAEPGFTDSREMQLRLKILEAGVLASDYLRKHSRSEIRATDLEIENYLNTHPELRESRKKEKAEGLLARVIAGEDFAKLAATESEDRTSKERGGLYEEVETDLVWPEVEQAVLALPEGKISPTLVETTTGFHIVKLERKRTIKKPDGSSSPRFSFRHILIQRTFEDPEHHIAGVPAPFLDARSIAIKVVEREKRDLFLRTVIARAGITMPDDL